MFKCTHYQYRFYFSLSVSSPRNYLGAREGVDFKPESLEEENLDLRIGAYFWRLYNTLATRRSMCGARLNTSCIMQSEHWLQGSSPNVLLVSANLIWSRNFICT